MTTLYRAITLLVVIAVSACGASSEKRPIEYSAINCASMPSYSLIQEPITLEITDQEAFEHYYYSADPDNNTQAPYIDFEKRSVVFFSLGEQPTTGNDRIDIRQVYEAEKITLVEYIRNRAPRGCIGDDALSYPYCFVSFDKKTRKVPDELDPKKLVNVPKWVFWREIRTENCLVSPNSAE